MLNYLKYLVRMTTDIFSNFSRIIELAKFEYKLITKGMALGQIWRLLNPLIQIGMYWLVFGLGIRNGAPVDGIPYVVWLSCGITAWLMASKGVGTSARSIYDKTSMLTRSNIPTCLIPISASVANIMDSVWLIVVLLIMFVCNGGIFTWYALGLVYYTLCIFVFNSVFGLIASVLGVLARDFLNLIQAVLRMLFFVSPIFWSPGSSSAQLFAVFSLYNPFAYVINGFRDSLLYNIPFWERTQELQIFWGMMLVLYLLGALFQSKLRKNLLDFV